MQGGLCNYYLGQYEEALAHYDIAISKYEKGQGDLLGTIFYNRGLANASLMRYEMAAEDQKNAIEKMGEQNNTSPMRFQLGVIFRRLANTQKDGKDGLQESYRLLDNSISELKAAL